MIPRMFVFILLTWIALNEARKFGENSLLPRPSTVYTNFSAKNARYLQINSPPPNIGLKLNVGDLEHSLRFVNENVNKLHRLETNLGWSNVLVLSNTPLHGQILVAYPENKAMLRGRQGLVTSKATVHLMHKFCRSHKISKGECAKYLSNIKLTDTAFSHFCEDVNKECSPQEIFSKYRTIDGSCNNPYEGSNGQSFTSYKRLLFPDYLDGVQEPRRSVHKRHSLPSARVISSSMIKHANEIDTSHTMMVPQWAQFVYHDLTHTVTSKMIHSSKTIKCCTTSGRKLSPRYIHPFCAPIEIAKNDKFYSQHGVKCMSYVRSVPAVRPSCTLGPLEQLNQATHFLDGSHIYGSDDKKATQLRLKKNGLLKTSTNHGRTFLPVQNENQFYFASGDPRAGTLPALAAIHTVWLREHNKIATQLHNVNPNWNDEILYQEARKIVIAEIQHITYNEWLPTVLGDTYVSKMQFPMDGITHLDSIEDPSISNSFATAAMRFEKSLKSNNLELYTEERNLNTTLRTEDYFNKPAIIESIEILDSVIRGLSTQNSQKLDLNFGTDITSQLYGNGKYGYDVVSLDIQRGRDHGLPGYTAFRSLCGLPEVETFNDFIPHIPQEIVNDLSKIYRDPHDVDLLIGGLAENPEGGSLLGPTFSCIISDQFLRTKYGDRYFYEHKEQPKPFTEKQLKEIKRTTLSRILCENADNVKTMQPNVFRTVSSSNALVSCNSDTIPRLNINYWME